MSNPLIDLQRYGQSVWYDNMQRGLIMSGELQGLIDNDGLRGMTSNPAIFEKAIAGKFYRNIRVRYHVVCLSQAGWNWDRAMSRNR